jgi:uncharacterized Zn-binding protein involved in type VI secretion
MTDAKTQTLPHAQQGDRLPCRGCPVTCPHYLGCDGKPWRMVADVVAPSRK